MIIFSWLITSFRMGWLSERFCDEDVVVGVLAMVNAYQNIAQIYFNRDGSHPEQNVVRGCFNKDVSGAESLCDC